MKPLLFAVGLAVFLLSLNAFLTEPPKHLELVNHSADSLLEAYGEPKLESEIRTFCTQCHAFPEPSLYPAYRWPAEVDRAMNFHESSGDTSLDVPDSRLILAWFKKHAKDRPVSKVQGTAESNTIFTQSAQGANLANKASISSILVVGAKTNKKVMMTGMLASRIFSTDSAVQSTETVHLANFPSRIRACDLSDEFEEEYLIANLGTPGVTDDLVGNVQWLRKVANGSFEAVTICDELGRVSDVKSADFDGDGDEDVVIAEFGWDKTGSVILMENTGGTFERSQIDARHGLVEVQLADMNRDGRMDFVGIFGQEYESVEVFHNVGGLQFEATVLFEAATPAFGMSSLNLVDVDTDGDVDIQFTSGDMYDSFHLQDHHGLYLLTNNNGEFEPRFISNQFAAMCSRAGDLDSDGDIDFVSASFIPQNSSYFRSEAYPAIVFHEQTSPGRWKSKVLKYGDCSHVAIELSDLDGDKDLDLIVGNFHDIHGSPEPPVSIWKNQSSITVQARR